MKESEGERDRGELFAGLMVIASSDVAVSLRPWTKLLVPCWGYIKHDHV